MTMDSNSILVTSMFLQPYLDAISNDSNASTVRAVVMKLLGDANIYNGYDEVKQRVIETKCSDDKVLSTLDLFSFGTLQDYQSSGISTEIYLHLNESQLATLRQLTALQLIQDTCRQKCNIVSYIALQKSLQLSTARDVEQVLARCVASNVVVGKLSQKRQAFIIHSLMITRDVHPESVGSVLLPAIHLFQQKLKESSDEIQNQQNSISTQLMECYTQQQNFKEKLHHSSSYTPALHAMRGGGNINTKSPSRYVASVDSMDVEFTSSAPAGRQKRSRGLGNTTVSDQHQHQ